jgi:hypothetical protein
MSQMAFSWGCTNYRKLTTKQKTDKILERSANRELFFGLAVKMLCIAEERGLRLIMENPWAEQTFLKANFIMPPTLIDKNRRLRGDYFEKPTAYWFVNCLPTQGLTAMLSKEKKTIQTSKGSKQAGLCSEERSMIHPDYARNFICDFIWGKVQNFTQQTLF